MLLLDDPNNVPGNLRTYIAGFSSAARDILEKFEFDAQITRLDPACGTGGMLSVAEDYLRTVHSAARLEVYGQELNAETYAVCRSDMMLKGQDASHIVYGNSFSEDGHHGARFDYLLANPPFGVEWKKVEDAVRTEHAKAGFAGRFGAGLPRINDGSFLFLQHMISKMKPVEQGGSRQAIVFNGSSLFTGAAGSGESEIRRWIIENDWLEAVVALPDQLFYNTGISTYFWIVTNRKSPHRRSKVQLVDARELFVKMRKSLGEKRKEISTDQIAEITRLYGEFTEGERVKILPNESFGFLRITVERPLRLRWEITDDTIALVRAAKGLAKLGDDSAESLEAALRAAVGFSSTDRKAAAKTIDAIATRCSLTMPQTKALWDALDVRDPEAPPVTDKKGNAEPDPDLRDGRWRVTSPWGSAIDPAVAEVVPANERGIVLVRVFPGPLETHRHYLDAISRQRADRPRRSRNTTRSVGDGRQLRAGITRSATTPELLTAGCAGNS